MRFLTWADGRTIRAFCALSCGLLLLTPTKAAAVQLIAKDQNGTPIPNVNLCLTMPQGSATKMTDQNGRYNFSLPLGSTGPATVRTSRNGFTNNQATINSGLSEQTIVLLPGQATPFPSFCGGVSAEPTEGNTACERITHVQMNGNSTTTNRTVNTVAVFSEKPAFYRITEFSAAERYPESQFNPDAAFAKKDVAWLPVITPLTEPAFWSNFTLTEPHYGTHHLYIQTSLALNGCVSRAREINVVLEPAQLATYELKGPALERFIGAAKSRGYQFKRPEFKFNKKDTTYCGNNAMLLPSNPVGDARVSNKVLEDVSASFEVFDGPDLMPFWQLMDIEGSFPGLPSLGLVRAFGSGAQPAVVYDKYSYPSCPYCGASALKRILSWRRLVYEFMSPPPQLPGPAQLPGSYNAVICATAPDVAGPDQPSLVKLILRGPAGEDPVNALGGQSSTMLQGIQRISPGKIIPRGVDEQSQPEERQPVDQPSDGQR